MKAALMLPILLWHAVVPAALARAPVPLPPEAKALEVTTLVSPLPAGAKGIQAVPLVLPLPSPSAKPSAPDLRIRATVRPGAHRPSMPAVPVASVGGLLVLEAHKAGDANALAAALKAEGIAPATGKVRPLPAFMTGLHWLPTMSFTYKHEDIDFPAAAVRVLRMADGTAEFLSGRMEAGGDRKYLLVVPDGDAGLTDAAAFRSMADRRAVAVVLGMGIASDCAPADFAGKASDVLSLLALLRRVTDAPVLLAVSWTNHHAGRRQIAGGWCRAFGAGLAKFDGLAVYNVGTFPLWESLTLKRLADALGMPADKPKVLLDFEGTRGRDDAAHGREVWRIRGRRFIEERKREGWRGVFLVTTGHGGGSVADLRAKAAMLDSLPADLKFAEKP